MIDKIFRFISAFSGTITIVVFVVSYLIFDGVFS